MHEALIIFKDKIVLKELIGLFKGMLEFTYVDAEMISYEEDENPEKFVSFALDTHALDIYNEDGIALFPNPVIYLVQFRDFDLFKKCITHIGKSYEIIVDNDHGCIIRDYCDVSKISDYRQFISQ